MQPDQKDFYSINEFSQKLSVHPNTIRRAVISGRILAIKMGTMKKWIYRIPSDELTRLLFVDLEDHINKIVDKRIDERTSI